MLVLHTHWQPPKTPADSGGLLFWGEDARASETRLATQAALAEAAKDTRRGGRSRSGGRQRGRRDQAVKPHPFAAHPDHILATLASASATARHDLMEGAAAARVIELTLWLPGGRRGPQPSPGLVHDWTLDDPAALKLLPWRIPAVWLPLPVALPLLIRLPELKAGPPNPHLPDAGRQAFTTIALAGEARYWHAVTALVLEALTAHKLAPVLVPAEVQGKPRFVARWLPVLDSPNDAARLLRLRQAMPPICRAEQLPPPAPERGKRPDQKPPDPPRTPGRRGRGQRKPEAQVVEQPRPEPPAAQQVASQPAPEVFPNPPELLDSFLNGCSDALARQWGRPAAVEAGKSAPVPQQWLAALFSDDPAVKGSAAQLQAFASSHRAWMRSLHAAGQGAFRVALRLEAPPAPTGADADLIAPNRKPRDDWRLQFMLQARDDPSLLVPAEEVWKTRGTALTQLGRRMEQPQEKLLAGLAYAARHFPPIEQSLKARQPTHLALNSQQAYNFLRQVAPLLSEAGFGLLAPPWWNQRGARLGVRLRMQPATASPTSRGKLSLDRLVRYQWELSLGDTTLTQEEFRALAAMKSPLVQIRGQWVQLDPEQIEAAIRFWKERRLQGETSLLGALQMEAALPADQVGLPVDDVVAEGWLADVLHSLQNATGDSGGAVLPLGPLSGGPEGNGHLPHGLHGQLRPYQQYGYQWLRSLRQWGLGACLADDMGLGKTIQALTLLLKEKELAGLGPDEHLPEPVLLVCPTSVVTNWERETLKFAPSLKTLLHQGPNRLRGAAFVDAAHQADIVLTSYVLVRQDLETLQGVRWSGVILDEAQNIKNPGTRQTQAVRQLKAEFRLALTGTPVENRLTELWSIMHFLNPGYLGTEQAFRRDYALPIERYADPKTAERLKKLVGPFILRRVKTDPNVIQDLPEKVETKVYCSLTEEQATLYEAVVQNAMQQIESSDGIARRGQVLSMLTQLKQLCNHPVQYLHQVPAGEPQAEAVSVQSLEGRSGKLERLVEMLEELLAVGDRALIFTQYAEMGHLLSSYLPQALGQSTLFLHGGVPAKNRDAMVRRFQEGESGPPVFILSLKAGGVGLNLTRANHVFHFDRWWNPAVEDQATDRAFRIGQQRNVQVHKFVTTGTLEEMIDDLIESKKGLAQAIIGAGENWLTEMSNTELRELVRLRVTTQGNK